MTYEELESLYIGEKSRWIRLVKRVNWIDDPMDIIHEAMCNIIPKLDTITSPGFIYKNIYWSAKWRRRAHGRATHNKDLLEVPFKDSSVAGGHSELSEQNESGDISDRALIYDPTETVEKIVDAHTLLQNTTLDEKIHIQKIYFEGLTPKELSLEKETSEAYISSKTRIILANIRERSNLPKLSAVFCSKCSKKLYARRSEGFQDPCYVCRRQLKKERTTKINR